MKKIPYVCSLIFIQFLLCSATFAYNPYSDNGVEYTAEQYRRDVKSYLDEQSLRQWKEDLRDSIYRGNTYTPTDADIKKLEKDIEDAKQKYDEQAKIISDQIIKTQEETARLKEKEQSALKMSEADRIGLIKHCSKVKGNQDSLYKDEILSTNDAFREFCATYGIVLNTDEEIFKKIEETKERKMPAKKSGVYTLTDILGMEAQKEVSEPTKKNSTIKPYNYDEVPEVEQDKQVDDFPDIFNSTSTSQNTPVVETSSKVQDSGYGIKNIFKHYVSIIFNIFN